MVNTHNLCQFEGRITRDPQFSTINTANGALDKALFTLAVDRPLTSAQRQQQNVKTTDFIPFSAVGAVVQTLKAYCPQGKAITVLAHYTEYQTQDPQTGQKKYGHMFEVDNIGFTVSDSKNLQNGGGGNQQQAPQQNYQQNNNNYQQNNYQQAPQQNYQQQPQQNRQQAPQNNFAMFDEANDPF